MVLLHELAHVRRGDVATHLMARVALSLYWWNPLAWTAWREFLKERERAADDLVLNSGAGATEYAGHLLEVARTMQAAPATAWAAIAMARPSQLEGRLMAILDSRRNRQQPGRLAAAVAALLAIAVVAPVAAVQSQEASPASQPPARANVPVFRGSGVDTVAGAVQSPEEQAVATQVEATIGAANNQKNFEMLEQAAAAFEKLRKYPEAQKLREAALAIREQVSGPAEPGLRRGPDPTGRPGPQARQGSRRRGRLLQGRGRGGRPRGDGPRAAVSQQPRLFDS